MRRREFRFHLFVRGEDVRGGWMGEYMGMRACGHPGLVMMGDLGLSWVWKDLIFHVRVDSLVAMMLW